jgi:hypothetical protein
MPRGTYELIMTRPNELISEMGQTQLTDRNRARGHLNNAIQMAFVALYEGSVSAADGVARIGRLLPEAKQDLATYPSLTTPYTQFLDSLEASIRHYAGGGQSPPPAGIEVLWQFTQDGLANALAQITVLRQQLGLSSAPSGAPNAETTTAP